MRTIAALDAVKDIKGTLARRREAWPWFDHILRAAVRYNDQRGDYFAAGITYYTVLALFPLIMVAFSTAGFVLSIKHEWLNTVKTKIRENVSGDIGNKLVDLLQRAVDSHATVGSIALLVGLWAGLGWMNNLRVALSELWEQKSEPPNWFVTKLADLGALIGLGLALVVSVGLSVLSSSPLPKHLLSAVGVEDAPGATLVIRIVSLVLSVLATWALFLWIIARLPRERVTWRSAIRAALLGALIFEVFKQVATFYLQIVLKSPVAATFGPIIGLMVFCFFTARIILFATAFAATSIDTMKLAAVPAPPPAIISPRVNVIHTRRSSAASFAAGMATALGLTFLRRR